MNSEHKDRSPSQPEESRIETMAASDPRLALIKKRAEMGYYNSDAVIQEIVEAMVEGVDGQKDRQVTRGLSARSR